MAPNALIDIDIRNPVAVRKQKRLFPSEVFLDKFYAVRCSRFRASVRESHSPVLLIVTAMEAHGWSAA
jgi:hypothetical protein